MRDWLWRWWPRLAARLIGRRVVKFRGGRPVRAVNRQSYALSDSPSRRVKGQPLIHWIRFGRVGASHFILAADPDWRRVLTNHGRKD